MVTETRSKESGRHPPRCRGEGRTGTIPGRGLELQLAVPRIGQRMLDVRTLAPVIADVFRRLATSVDLVGFTDGAVRSGEHREKSLDCSDDRGGDRAARFGGFENALGAELIPLLPGLGLRGLGDET